MQRRIVMAGLAAGAVLAGAGAAPAGAEPLPVVRVDAEERIGGRGKVPARMRLPGYDGRVGIEIRGRWSRRFPKKSFGFETRDAEGENLDVGLLGMPADDDWVLYAAYNDRTLLRNVLAYDTARWIGRYAARTRFVELQLNGRYRGVYVLMEKLKVQRDRVQAGDDGVLLELTSRRQAPRKGTTFRTPLTRRPIAFEDPERADLSAREARRARQAVARADRALEGGRARSWRRHLEPGAAVDFVLLQELFKNEDALHASTFMSTSPGGRIELGPIWDFDVSMGASRRGPSRILPGWMLANRPWARALYREPGFARALDRRWRALRAAGLEARLVEVVTSEAARLAPAARRDLARWPVAGERPAGDAAAHVERLVAWLRARIAWLDANLPALARRASRA